MFAVLCRRQLRAPPKDCIFVAQQFCLPQNAVLSKSCSSRVCGNASEKSFTVSYLINSCGLSSKEATTASNKLCFKSPEKPDAVLELLRKYGFTNAHIHILVTKRPNVLSACPHKTLLPKLEFFRSIGVPLPVLARTLSKYPYVLKRGLENSLVPSYNDLKNLLQSDERAVRVFLRNPTAFAWRLSKGVSYNISMLREKGVPESSIVKLVVYQPSVLVSRKDKLARYVDRAVQMGFDITKSKFIQAVCVFVTISESTLKHKTEVYKRCGWSEPEIGDAFLRFPFCMKLSEKNILATVDFLVDKVGCEPAAIAQCPVVLGLNIERRMKPRWLVARILNEKGLKNVTRVITFFMLSEKEFLKRYIVKYQKDIPELLGIYQGKLRPSDLGFSQEVLSE